MAETNTYRCSTCGDQFTINGTTLTTHVGCGGAWVPLIPNVGLVTERAAVLRERAAFTAGANWYRGDLSGNPSIKLSEPTEARHRYPLPTKRVTRPREVKDPGLYDYRWRVVNGRIQFFGSPRMWLDLESNGVAVTQERAELLADLLANPTETVFVDDTGD